MSLPPAGGVGETLDAAEDVETETGPSWKNGWWVRREAVEEGGRPPKLSRNGLWSMPADGAAGAPVGGAKRGRCWAAGEGLLLADAGPETLASASSTLSLLGGLGGGDGEAAGRLGEGEGVLWFGGGAGECAPAGAEGVVRDVVGVAAVEVSGGLRLASDPDFCGLMAERDASRL